MLHDQETNDTSRDDRSGDCRYQPRLARGLLLRDRRRGQRGFRGWGGRDGGNGAGALTGFHAVSYCAFRGLLGGIGLHLAADPLSRPAGIGRRQAPVEGIDLAQFVLAGGYFVHVLSLRSSRSFNLAWRRRELVASMVLSVISAISPTLN